MGSAIVTPNQIEEAALFHGLGLSWEKIGECFGVSVSEVLNYFCAEDEPEHRKLCIESADEMAELFGKGYSTRCIGEKFGISGETVRRRLSEKGVDLGGKGRKLQITSEYVDIARKMREQGHGWIAISSKIGFSARQLQKHLYDKSSH